MKFLTSTGIAGFEIYAAEPGDEGLVQDFVMALAVYEKLEHEVVAERQDFEKYLFGPSKVAEVVFGVLNGKAVGFALFFHNFSTFLGKPGIYLEDLFVLEEYRGKGYGKCLLTWLGKEAVARGCGRLEWAVLDWNEPSIKFYESLGAKIMKEWLINRVTGQSLGELASMFPES